MYPNQKFAKIKKIFEICFREDIVIQTSQIPRNNLDPHNFKMHSI